MSNSTAAYDPMADLFKDLVPLEATQALKRLQMLVQTEPDLRLIRDDYSFPPETLKWLGDLHAVVVAMKRITDQVPLQTATNKLVQSQGSLGRDEIRMVLYRALAAAELAAPASEQGAFVAAGNELDAYAAISKVLASATKDLMVVDPYLDGKALTDFLPSADENVFVRILADEAFVKPTMAPSLERWKKQFPSSRKVEARLASGRSLHDRLLIVDEKDAWLLTQSLKDFAHRAHGSIMKTDVESAGLKISAYGDLWRAARPI